MNVIQKIFYILCILFLVWFLLGFAEVNSKNLTENPKYSKYNIFVVFDRGVNND